jgi:type IV secretion system protein VirB10
MFRPPTPPAPQRPKMVSYAMAAAPVTAGAGPGGDPSALTGAGGNGPSATAVAFKGAAVPGGKAGIIPDRSFVAMPQIVQCNLDQAIDSTVPGPIMCHLEQDVLSPDNIILMEKGTLIMGEYRAGLQQGQDRIMAVAATAYTPFGVVVPLDGPMADGLGRAGIPGEVDHHNLERFGGAILMSFATSAFTALQSLAQGGNNNNNLTFNTGSMQNVASDVLRSTLNIPPTLTANQGATISIYIRYPIDFSAVYQIRTRR